MRSERKNWAEIDHVGDRNSYDIAACIFGHHTLDMSMERQHSMIVIVLQQTLLIVRMTIEGVWELLSSFALVKEGA